MNKKITTVAFALLASTAVYAADTAPAGPANATVVIFLFMKARP